jgi:ribosomal-protein-alanine N-acetyltransferase
MVRIEKMDIDDFIKIKDILESEFDDFWTPNILEGEIKSELSHYFIAKDNGKILGFAGFKVMPDDIEITNIVTRKLNRGHGIGKALLETIISESKIYGKKNITLEVNKKNIIAINLYDSFGFEKVGERSKYYNGTDDAIIMTRPL